MQTSSQFDPASMAGDIRAHYQSLGVAVFIPAAQAGITGASLGLSAAALAWLAGQPDIFKYGLAAAGLAQAGAWLVLMDGWRRMVRDMERALGVDLDQDGVIGDPVSSGPQVVRLEVSREGGRHVQIIDLPISGDKARQLLYGLVVDGRTLAESDWTGRGKPFSRAEFRTLRDVLVKRGIANWINPAARAQGITLTASGKQVLRSYAQEIGIVKDVTQIKQ